MIRYHKVISWKYLLIQNSVIREIRSFKRYLIWWHIENSHKEFKVWGIESEDPQGKKLKDKLTRGKYARKFNAHEGHAKTDTYVKYAQNWRRWKQYRVLCRLFFALCCNLRLKASNESPGLWRTLSGVKRERRSRHQGICFILSVYFVSHILAYISDIPGKWNWRWN